MNSKIYRKSLDPKLEKYLSDTISTLPSERTYKQSTLISLYHQSIYGWWIDAYLLMLSGGLGYRNRICELRDMGFNIEKRYIPKSKEQRGHYEFRLAIGVK